MHLMSKKALALAKWLLIRLFFLSTLSVRTCWLSKKKKKAKLCANDSKCKVSFNTRQLQEQTGNIPP